MNIRQNKSNRVIIKLRKLHPQILIISALTFITVSFSGSMIESLFGNVDLTELCVPIGRVCNVHDSILSAIWTLIQWAISLGTIVGTIFLIISGIMYMTALGDKEGMEKAKRGLLWSVVGILVLVVSYVVVGYLFNTFLLKSGSNIPINI